LSLESVSSLGPLLNPFAEFLTVTGFLSGYFFTEVRTVINPYEVLTMLEAFKSSALAQLEKAHRRSLSDPPSGNE
jgi:hypothetical protein